MDRVTEDIKSGLQLLASQFGPSPIQPASVEAVNDDDTISVRLSSDLVIDDVRLKSVINGTDKMVITPKVGSTVLIASIENSFEFICLAVEEVTEVYYKIGDTEIRQNSDGLLIKKGNDSLGKAVDDLIKEILKISAPMDKPAVKLIQDRVKQILTQ